MEHAMDLRNVREKLLEAVELRNKYVPVPYKAPEAPERPPPEVRYEFQDGIVRVTRSSDGTPFGPRLPEMKEFYDDMHRLFQIRMDGAVSTFCYHRLKILQMKFEVQSMTSFDVETKQQHATPHRDFYNTRKVDTHIHHSAAMNAKHLLRFIKKKLKHFETDVVGSEHGSPVTLKQVFERLEINWHDLSLDRLNVLADRTTMYRFDRFNNKYSPLGNPMLRTIFLKTDNEMGGRYLAEITRELLDDLEESKYQHTEWRLSIYGRDRQEWGKLAKWVVGHKLTSANNKWMIQIPRLYSLYKAAGQVRCFQEFLDNIFMPLFEATLNPEGHPLLHEFLEMISGFDTVDDESKSETPAQRTFSSKERTPANWDITDNPSYKYYNFYLQSNIRTLNYLRASRGLSQFSYRPHAGEAGETHHLDAAFLLADGISHGINLRKSMGLQYLFYICQIGMAMSPCSNNQLFLSYDKHPFPDFFKRGLNVSLSTDDPLMFHHTKEPLMEEYSIARQIWRLTSADLCELARNSVLQSGFSREVKEHWLGTPHFDKENLISCTNVPDLRIQVRKDCLDAELRLLHSSDDTGLEALHWGYLHPTPGPKRESVEAPSPWLSPAVPPEEGGAAMDLLPSEQAEATEQLGQKDEELVGSLLQGSRCPTCSITDAGGAQSSLLGMSPGLPGGSGQAGAKRRRLGGASASVVPQVSANTVVLAFGEAGLLRKLLSEHPYDVVQAMAAHLCALHEGQDTAALEPHVNAAWRLAVLNTVEYQQVCERCFGRIIHHSTQTLSAVTASMKASGEAQETSSDSERLQTVA